MKLYYTDHFVLPLPEGHRFPMVKYAALRARVAAAPWFDPGCLRVPGPASEEELTRAHDAAYVEKVRLGTLSAAEIRRIGFPWSEGMVERSRRSAGATLAACRTALAEGCGVNLAGGTHHAFRDHGEGYCVFNDAAVAARAMQAEGRAERIAVIDCDVHQGNGTAAILAGDSSIFTFSIHGRNNFPFHKERSDLDIELADGAGDDEYLSRLGQGLAATLRLGAPELVIYLAGADPHEGDRLGRLKVTREGLAQRDAMVLDACDRAGAPVAVAMAGGYGRNIDDTVDIHYRTVQEAWRRHGGGAPAA